MEESLGDHRILERIGGGAAAAVFRGRDTRSGRTVAIKQLTSTLADDPRQRREFIAEAQAASALFHPNIAALFAIGEHDHRPYLVFEFVQGQTLRALMAGQALNARRAIDIVIQVADGLADAHASNVIHRAIAPDTIVVTPTGNAKVIDFGLGGYLTAVAMRARRPAGTVAAPYWAPEQIAGATVDHRVDIYALGLVLTEMLTGRRPAAATALTGQLPLEVSAIIRRMIADDPARRFASAATLAAELRQAAAQMDARPAVATVAPATAPSNRGSRWMLFVLALVAAALIWVASRLR